MVRKIGNLEGVLNSKETFDRLHPEVGGQSQHVATGKELSPEPLDDAFDRQMKAARERMDKYRVALQKLAQ